MQEILREAPAEPEDADLRPGFETHKHTCVSDIPVDKDDSLVCGIIQELVVDAQCVGGIRDGMLKSEEPAQAEGILTGHQLLCEKRVESWLQTMLRETHPLSACKCMSTKELFARSLEIGSTSGRFSQHISTQLFVRGHAG